jgi:hypothetical protein
LYVGGYGLPLHLKHFSYKHAAAGVEWNAECPTPDPQSEMMEITEKLKRTVSGFCQKNV